MSGILAESDDGVHFTIRDQPLIDLTRAPYPFNQLTNPAIIDYQVTQIDDTYYLVAPVHIAPGGPVGLLGQTKDFQTYEPLETISLPDNRGISLFPEKINGQYYRLDRPTNAGSIWLSSSPDLFHWGRHRLLLEPGYELWNRVKVGPTLPIKTPTGWLVIVHGVWSWQPSDFHYHIGAILLDSEYPERILGKTSSWLLAPEADYETRGMISDVVFPCGALVDLAKDELRLYYGAADTCIGLTTGSVSEVIDACRQGW